MIVFLVADSIACAIPLKQIKEDLDRVGCPPRLQRLLPVIKLAAAAGLFIGLWVTGLGLVTSICLVAYFICAVGFHVRIKDTLAKTAPAAALVLVCAAIALIYV
jgi:uncharacterized membrane protein YiaA